MGIAGERPGLEGIIGDGFEDATVSDEKLSDKENDRCWERCGGGG
jgi:hypothetical protein